LLEKLENIDRNYKVEFIRKAIHFCSLSIPVAYYFLSKETTLSILIPLAALFVLFDLGRYYTKSGAKYFYKYFGWLLRHYEIDEKRKRLNGASNILISAIVCILFFPKIFVINAFTILIISDSSAALIGRRFGKHKFFKKSLEGSLAFFISAALVVLVIPKVEKLLLEYVITIIAVGIGTIMEATSVVIDDNYTIPISICIVMWVLYLILLPQLNIFKMIG
jgi:dolichol kinase